MIENLPIPPEQVEMMELSPKEVLTPPPKEQEKPSCSKTHLRKRRPLKKQEKAQEQQRKSPVIVEPQEDIKASLFLNPIKFMQTTLNLGYFLGISPFCIQVGDTGYKIKTNCCQKIVAFLLLVFTIVNQIMISREEYSSTEGIPRFLNNVNNLSNIILSVVYTYQVFFKRERFLTMFQQFKETLQITSREAKKPCRKARDFVAHFLFLLLLVVNWNCWGWSMYTFGFKETFSNISYFGKEMFGNPEVAASSSWIFFLLALISQLYMGALKVFIEILMMAEALTLDDLEKAGRKETLSCNAEKGCKIFQVSGYLSEEVCQAMGPLSVAYYFQLMPFVLQLFSFEEKWTFFTAFIAVLKIAQVFKAAGVAANASACVRQFLDRKASSCDALAFFKITTITQRPIVLSGMNFFDVKYNLMGRIGLHMITYLLLIWSSKN